MKKIGIIIVALICVIGYFPSSADAGTLLGTYTLPAHCELNAGTQIQTTVRNKTYDDSYSNVTVGLSSSYASMNKIYTSVYWIDLDAGAVVKANPNTLTTKNTLTYEGYYSSLSGKIIRGEFVKLYMWNYISGYSTRVSLNWDYR